MNRNADSAIRVLYVDDSQFDRELVREALRTSEWDFDLVEAESQSMFEACLKQQRYDVVLSDFNILGFEGLQVIDEVRARRLGIPVVIVTGTGSEEVAVASMKRGAADYVIKTTSHIQKLPHTIVAAVQKEQLERERRQAQLKLQRNEEHFRALIENARDLITVCDATGTIRYQSASVERVLGRAVQDVLGVPLFSLAHPEDRDRLQACFSKCLEQERRSDRRYDWLEFRMRHKDGNWRLLEASLRNLLCDSAVRGVVINASDISQRRRLEREILQVGSQEQRRIGRDLHDDLGQLLTAIGLRMAGLRRDLEEELPAEAEKAGEIGELVSQAIDRTRKLARGLNPVDRSGPGLSAALSRLADFTQRNFAVACRVACPDQMTIDDPDAAIHIYRIVQEGISNAVSHGHASRILIEVAWDAPAEGERRQVKLTIQDNGGGINGRCRDFCSAEGGGMGLRIMQHRARLIGGSFDIAPRPEGGTVVQCSFRLRHP